MAPDGVEGSAVRSLQQISKPASPQSTPRDPERRSTPVQPRSANHSRTRCGLGAPRESATPQTRIPSASHQRPAFANRPQGHKLLVLQPPIVHIQIHSMRRHPRRAPPQPRQPHRGFLVILVLHARLAGLPLFSCRAAPAQYRPPDTSSASNRTCGCSASRDPPSSVAI